LALIAIDALLALALAALWFAPGPPVRWRNWQLPAPQAPNLDDARAAQLSPNLALRRDYPAIVERPLFAADRKPRAAASDAQATAAPPPDDFDQVKLYGLIDGPASQGVLLEQNGQSQFTRLGEKIGNWTLQAIEGRNAIFVKGAEKRTISLPDSLIDTTNVPAASTSAPPPSGVSVSRPGLPAPLSMPTPGKAPGAILPRALPGLGGQGGANIPAQPRPAIPAAGGLRPVAYSAFPASGFKPAPI
jgi:hypothetical protein